ncbi:MULTISPECIES: hypothetical protein [Streptomyces]|uniref:Uncharacterized protein n=1 Tax=Streptomyces sp. NBC_00093 TaxID=2975649 RepID=A0AAU1ZWN9_9ACTN
MSGAGGPNVTVMVAGAMAMRAAIAPPAIAPVAPVVVGEILRDGLFLGLRLMCSPECDVLPGGS